LVENNNPTNNLRLVVGHHLEEDVVASLIRKLECHSRLFQQVYLGGEEYILT